MSADTTQDRAIARGATNIIKGISAAMSGKERGRDRKVRRDSYDIDDVKAKPWAPVGDGSVAQGLAHRDALLQAAEEHRHQGWKNFPLAEARASRRVRGELAAELAHYLQSGDAPIGRPAAIRIELARLDALIEETEQRLRRIDITVLKAVVRCVRFESGRMFPAHETIAALAGCCEGTVKGALARLKRHGFIAWVRRSMKKPGSDGQFAPQREQTSNAYYFDHRRRMAPRTWQRFWQLLVAKLRRFGATPAGLRPAPPTGPPSADVVASRVAIASLGASLTYAST